MATENDTWTSDALQRGDLDAIRHRVSEEPTFLESRDFLDDTPLLSAISCDQVELVRFLLEAGADPNVRVNDGYTCLLSACESKVSESVEIVRLLIASGAELGTTGTNGYTPLHMAAAHGSVEKLKLLLEAGSEVDRRTEIDGCTTPLMEAARAGHPGAVELLLEHGADASLEEDVRGHTPADLARAAGKGADPEIARALKEMEAIDRASVEAYVQAADKCAREGDHAGVLRVLALHMEGGS